MNKKIKYIIPALLFALATLYLIKEIYFAHTDISNNNSVISNLTSSTKKDKQEMNETKEKIKDMNTNPKALERVLREQYNIIRKDQYIIQKKNDSDNINQQQNDGANDKNN